MNYQKIYDSLIISRKKLNRNKKDGTYYEKHHIIPFCCSGTNDKENLVFLTAKEHFVAHLLLVHCCKGIERSKMIYALWAMQQKSKGQKRNLSSSQYEFAKKLLVLEKKGKRTGIENPFYGKKHTEKTLQIIREKRREQNKRFGGSPSYKKIEIYDVSKNLLFTYNHTADLLNDLKENLIDMGLKYGLKGHRRYYLNAAKFQRTINTYIFKYQRDDWKF